jgi:hypothetical protein
MLGRWYADQTALSLLGSTPSTYWSKEWSSPRTTEFLGIGIPSLSQPAADLNDHELNQVIGVASAMYRLYGAAAGGAFAELEAHQPVAEPYWEELLEPELLEASLQIVDTVHRPPLNRSRMPARAIYRL